MIVDDEPFVRDGLRYMLSAHQNVEVAWEAGKLDEARNILSENRPDVVFLDVQLRGGTGFDLIPDIDPETRIIFISAHEENIKDTPETNTVDRILKPISAERLAESLKKLKR